MTEREEDKNGNGAIKAACPKRDDEKTPLVLISGEDDGADGCLSVRSLMSCPTIVQRRKKKTCRSSPSAEEHTRFFSRTQIYVSKEKKQNEGIVSMTIEEKKMLLTTKE